MKNIIKKVTKKYKTTEQELRKEMQLSIRAAMQSKDPVAQALWKQISPDGKEPPVNNYKYNWNNGIYKNSNHIKVMDIRQEAEKKIAFYREQIISKVNKKSFIHSY